ncbi:MAG: AraC family transcriptional regulator [Verrucomicrobiota bacterium]
MDAVVTRYDPPVSLTPCPVETITGFWRFVRKPHFHWHGRSLPGHVVQLVVSGSYRLVTDGRAYDIRKGHVTCYHGPEDIEWVDNDAEVVLFSIGFLAPQIEPPPLDMRVIRSTAAIRRSFYKLQKASLVTEGKQRALGMHAALLDILYQINSLRVHVPQAGQSHAPWWAIESQLREQKLFRPTLHGLSALAGRSTASVVRLCRRATGLSPLQRVRAIRMEESRALLMCSDLNVSQVAEYLGYSRVHELSRDFKRYFGVPPRVAKSNPHGGRSSKARSADKLPVLKNRARQTPH